MRKSAFIMLLMYFVIVFTISNTQMLNAAIAPGKIAFESTRDGASVDPYYDEIYVMNEDGTNIVRLTNSLNYDGVPTWSPDGTKIAFESWRDGNREIYVMDADGANQTNLTNYAALDEAPSWSPDGTKIAFDSSRSGQYEIWVMDSDGSNLMRLTTDYGNVEPAWSPDGEKIVYEFQGEIATINIDGTNKTVLTSNTGRDGWPAWSPDGTKIAFVSEKDGNTEIYIMNTDGSNQVNLSSNAARDWYPSWSADGTKVFFESDRDGQYELYSINIDGTSLTRLTDNPAYDEAPMLYQDLVPHDTWVTKMGLSIGKRYFGITEANNKIYVVSGETGRAPGYFYLSNAVDEYDPYTDTWVYSKSTIPVARELLGVVTLNGKIYAIGGLSCWNGYASYARNDVYDPIANTWESKAPMVYAKYGAGVVACNNKIYVIGGVGTNQVQVYDPETDTWSLKTGMPTARAYVGAAAVGKKIYIIGGYNSTLVDEYDTETDTWTTKSSMPSQLGLGFLGTAVINDKIYTFGGIYEGVNRSTVYNSVYRYDPQNDQWTTLTGMQIARWGLGAVGASDGKIYAIGGSNFTGSLQTAVNYFKYVEEYTP
jgi:TolB protein